MRIRLVAKMGLALTCMGFIASGAAAQLRSSVPYSDYLGPLFSIKEPNYVYPSSYNSLRTIGFRNFSIHLRGDSKGARLRNGSYEHKDEVGYEGVTLNEVHYLVPSSASTEYVLMLLQEDSTGGSSSQVLIAQVLELSKQSLRIVQEISADLHYGGPYFTHPFDASTRTLVLHSGHYLPGDAHCCVSAMDVLTFKWNGSRFVETSLTTELTDCGKREGKKLRP